MLSFCAWPCKKKGAEIKETKKTINDLPPEILREILAYLQHSRKFCRLRCVSRSFWPLVNELATWNISLYAEKGRDGTAKITKAYHSKKFKSPRKLAAIPCNHKTSLVIGSTETTITVTFMDHMTKLLGENLRPSYLQLAFDANNVPHSHWENFFRMFGRYVEYFTICSSEMNAQKFEIFARFFGSLPKLHMLRVSDLHTDDVRSLFQGIANARGTTWFMCVSGRSSLTLLIVSRKPIPRNPFMEYQFDEVIRPIR
uniref:F-box domain-containing protein n=1 Tax=Steinernema glaseri TaxID=37863 RepID=A0A1I7YJ52_9BILA